MSAVTALLWHIEVTANIMVGTVEYSVVVFQEGS
jgi:hypothetical protein